MLSNYSKLKKILDHLKDPKIFLSLFVSLIGFIGFSSASYTIIYNSDNGSFNPSSISLSSDFVVGVSSFVCDDTLDPDDEEDSVSCGMTLDDEYGNLCEISSIDGTIYTTFFDEDENGSSPCFFTGGQILTVNSNINTEFTSITLYNNNSGESGSDNGSSIVAGGISAFTPVISSVSNIISEFIPYVVYVGLGILGVIIGFVAIKRLINWIRAKIFSSFK